MPLGRLVGVVEADDMADKGVAGSVVYLRGEFSVTASGDYQAVLRLTPDTPAGRDARDWLGKNPQ
jgi:hypothetical protein